MEDDIKQHKDANGKVAPNSYIRVPVSATQAKAMQAGIEKRTTNPGRYNLLFRNCAGFVEYVLHAGGVHGVPHAEVISPALLGAILALGNPYR